VQDQNRKRQRKRRRKDDLLLSLFTHEPQLRRGGVKNLKKKPEKQTTCSRARTCARARNFISATLVEHNLLTLTLRSFARVGVQCFVRIVCTVTVV